MYTVDNSEPKPLQNAHFAQAYFNTINVTTGHIKAKRKQAWQMAFTQHRRRRMTQKHVDLHTLYAIISLYYKLICHISQQSSPYVQTGNTCIALY